MHQRRNSIGRTTEIRLNVITVLFKTTKRKFCRDAIERNRFSIGLEASDEQPANIFAHLDMTIGIVEDGQTCVDARYRFGQHIKMLARIERHVGTAGLGNSTRPYAGTVDNNFALDRSRRGHDPRDSTVVYEDPLYRNSLDDL